MPTPSANELLGFSPDARLLIINADDFGAYHAVTAGTFRATTEGIARSTTVMMPCPWARHALRLLKEHPEISFGVHLTVVSEFTDYRWGPLSPRDRVPSLLDDSGYFHRNDPGQPFLTHFVLDEVTLEIRAQIESVLAAGLQPTHLDWHCLRDGGRSDIFDLTVSLAREYGLALRVFDPARGEHLKRQGLPTVDHEVVDSTRLPTAGKTAHFIRILRELPPGLSEWAVHPALPTPEARAIDPWWAKRAADLEFLTSDEAHETVQEEGIILLDYRPLQAHWRQRTPSRRA